MDPTTFPIEISGEPSKAALKLTNNSGAEVPKATTVIPTTKGVILNFKAIEVAPLTRISPPPTKAIKPKMINI